jgi:hypothetical protein
VNGHISRCELLAWPQSQCTIHGVLPTIQHLGVTLLASSCPYALYVPRIQLVARSAPANHGELFYSRLDLSVKQRRATLVGMIVTPGIRTVCPVSSVLASRAGLAVVCVETIVRSRRHRKGQPSEDTQPVGVGSLTRLHYVIRNCTDREVRHTVRHSSSHGMMRLNA